MKVLATADLHGCLPPIEHCDLLLIAGDICPGDLPTEQAHWLDRKFRRWLDNIPAKHVVACWGNHDQIGHRAPELVPPGLRWTVLTDDMCQVKGLKIWGIPWQRPYNVGFVFNMPEPDLSEKYRCIPKVDILLSHAPPQGYGDRVCHMGRCEQVGSPGFTNWIIKKKPKLCVYGHIHVDSGDWNIGDSRLANVSYMTDCFDERSQSRFYHPHLPPQVFHL